MGELLANMNCAHNDHILAHFMATNEYTVEPFAVTGIFLHKQTGCSKLVMDLKPTADSTPQHPHFNCFKYHIQHIITPSQLLEPPLLCAALHEYAAVNLH